MAIIRTRRSEMGFFSVSGGSRWGAVARGRTRKGGFLGGLGAAWSKLTGRGAGSYIALDVGSSSIKLLEVRGPGGSPEIVRAGKGVYNVRTGIVRLEENVKITRGKTQLNGNEAEVDLNTGISRVIGGTGRVRGLIQPHKRR